MTKDEVLKIITEHPGIRQNDIGSHIGIRNCTVSKQANKLRRDKLAYPVYRKRETFWFPGVQASHSVVSMQPVRVTSF